jgi:Flp pilus assembly CpaF family ATPase
MGRCERRFDAANPEDNLQLPDGSRLFAAVEVSARPSVVIRGHRFELSSLDELCENGLIERSLLAF